ncbi:MAG: hypothetical protein ABJI96_08990 [Paracoccaceae bacterium]
MDKTTILRRLAKLQRVDTLRALPPGVAAVKVSANVLGQSMRDVSDNARSDLESFLGAGWTFNVPEETNLDQALEVFLGGDGHIKLLGRTLVVKISEDLDGVAVNAWLKGNGLTLRRKLGFAANTFLVDTSGMSALNVAQTLNELPEVLYAEPNFIEPIQSR